MRFSALILVAASLVTSTALARSPQCYSGNGERGYKEGYNLETNVLRTVRARFDCNNIEDFVKAIDIPFGTYSTSAYLRCRNEGIRDAVESAIIDAQTE